MSKNSKLAIIIACVTVLLIGIIITVIALSSGDKATKDEAYTMSVVDGEPLSLAHVRAAIAQSALDGSGEITPRTCEILGNMVKNYDETASWFSSCSYSFTGSISDTSDAHITKMSDDDYCATFTTDLIDERLTGYSFEEGACGDSRFSVEEPDNTQE